jgi:hypothetical protein
LLFAFFPALPEISLASFLGYYAVLGSNLPRIFITLPFLPRRGPPKAYVMALSIYSQFDIKVTRELDKCRRFVAMRKISATKSGRDARIDPMLDTSRG